MRTGILIRPILIPLLTLCLSAVMVAQEKKSPSYVPEVGQQGKDVVWVPTPSELVDVMLRTAKVTADDYVIDLGSGDGRTVIAAAKLGAHAVGVEYNPEMVALSKRNAANEGVSDKTEFYEADLYQFDLSKATVITMFLLPEINLKLRPKLLDLKPGTRIVSNTFTMGEWTADYEVTTEENWNSWNQALMWIVPAKVEGTWELGLYPLQLKQDFQMIYGDYIIGSKETPVNDGRLSGNEITFKLNGELYTGKIEGNKMGGTVTNDNGSREWSAIKL